VQLNIRKGKGEGSDIVRKDTVDSVLSKFCEHIKKVWGVPVYATSLTKQEVAATVASYIVLLPMRDENYVRRNFYYVVTHNWEERNSNGEFKVEY
jgi:hypothetical protein